METVTLRRLVAPGARVPREPPVANTGDTWEATFDLSEAQNGFVAFECQAEGRTPAGEPTCGVSRVTTWLDLGPELTLVRPEEETFLRDRLSLAWDVVPLPLTSDPGEAGAQIAEVQLRVAGADITSGIESAPSEEDGRPGALRYTADVDLNDATLFPSGLDGRQQLLVRVTNARGASREALRAFNIDEEGPDITFLTPDEGALVGGLVTVRIEATDPAGVDATSLQLRVADRVFDFRPVDGVANEYTSSFNAADFPDDPSVILSVTARDGNATPNTASRTVRLDSAPPIAALDPVDVRAVRETSRDVQCSVLFDPVGSDSVDDGEIVLSQGEFRARVEDVGNVTLGDGVVTFVSGVRSVELYIFQPTDADPRSLLVDTNGDDLCDDISSEVLPVPGVMDPAELVVLGGVRPTGAPRGDELDFSGAGVPASAYADGAIYADCTEENGSETPALALRRVLAAQHGHLLAPRQPRPGHLRRAAHLRRQLRGVTGQPQPSGPGGTVRVRGRARGGQPGQRLRIAAHSLLRRRRIGRLRRRLGHGHHGRGSPPGLHGRQLHDAGDLPRPPPLPARRPLTRPRRPQGAA